MNKHDVLLARKCANDALDGDNPDAKVTALARRLNQALNFIDILKNQLERDRVIWFNERSGLDSQIRDLKDMLIVAAKLYGTDGEIKLSESHFVIANTVHGKILKEESTGDIVVRWGR